MSLKVVKAVFFKRGERLSGFEISGHADYTDDESADIACASVSSAVMLTANSITHFFDIKAEVAAKENLVTLELPNRFEGIEAGFRLVESLKEHLKMVAEDYEGTVEISVLERV